MESPRGSNTTALIRLSVAAACSDGPNVANSGAGLTLQERNGDFYGRYLGQIPFEVRTSTELASICGALFAASRAMAKPTMMPHRTAATIPTRTPNRNFRIKGRFWLLKEG